jgi:hypothetical protein
MSSPTQRQLREGPAQGHANVAHSNTNVEEHRVRCTEPVQERGGRWTIGCGED